MRTEAIIVFVLVAATPAHASKTCMTMAEARQQYATTHLYWHGAGHCWDATPPRHRVVRVKPREDQQAKRDNREPVPQEPKWRNAMSEMLPADAPGIASALPSLPAIATTGLNWLDRWVDVAQVAPPSFLGRSPQLAAAEIPPTAREKADPMVTPMRLILVFLSIVVILAVIELLFRNTIHERLD